MAYLFWVRMERILHDAWLDQSSGVAIVMMKLRTWAAAAAMLALSGAAQSALVNRGGGMIYDTTANITWLADMNYAYTSGYAASGVAPGSTWDENTIWTDGSMGWAAAKNWADNLVYGGFSDWRLPTLNPSDTTCSNSYDPTGGFGPQYYGYHCTGGELSRLFVTELGNKALESVLDQTGDTAEQIANLALFSNVQSYSYWSGTEYAPSPGYAWFFFPNYGNLNFTNKESAFYAVAVRPGDVAATVPEPQTLVLAMMAMGGAMLMRRKQPR